MTQASSNTTKFVLKFIGYSAIILVCVLVATSIFQYFSLQNGFTGNCSKPIVGYTDGFGDYSCSYQTYYWDQLTWFFLYTALFFLLPLGIVWLVTLIITTIFYYFRQKKLLTEETKIIWWYKASVCLSSKNYDPTPVSLKSKICKLKIWIYFY